MSTYTINNRWPVVRPRKPIESILGVMQLRFEPHTAIGLVLIFLYELQYVFNLSPQWLVELQHVDWYRQTTGFVLLLFILTQWRLAYARMTTVTAGRFLRNGHKYSGLVGPLVLYVHTVSLGYAYQELLLVVFLCNYFVGLLNPDVFLIKLRHYYTSWLLTHITLSITIIGLMVFHMYVIYAY